MNDLIKNKKIAIIGLGYVGLPLAVEFGKQFPTVGFDINQSRVDELNSGKDSTLEVEDELLLSVIQKGDSGSIMTKTGLQITTDNAALN
ncbi:MAG: hypothetical protein P8Q41_06710, partial [Saprospiraceae bacterium]|nr:hypothetical protein [Saprospiraceae bacterium]